MAKYQEDRYNSPTYSSDGREIWLMIRSWITLIRVLLVIAIIIIAEIFEEHELLNLSVSVWAIVVGFPTFLLLSVTIIQGDKRFAPDLEEKRRKQIDKP
ncbi:MAG: hypothetical protein HOE76_03665 [Euryarchaeota archaeon]|jgi:hypothetical protein|nr:hypothetical protein [Euryarchaeota archaeon]MBT4981810.1 hypothetical protein [Euryarchaeota archaeon]MBT5184592.1 hypothetical protein [Euryarchaeota archaeon]